MRKGPVGRTGRTSEVQPLAKAGRLKRKMWRWGGKSGLQGQRVAEHAAAWPAAGQRADEVDGVDLDVLAVTAVAEGTARRPVKHEVERQPVELRPFGHDVGDQPAVVVRLEVHRPARRVAGDAVA